MSTGQSTLWIAKYPKMVIFNQEIHSDISKKWNFKHTHAIVQDCTWLEHKLDITVIKHVSYCIQPTALQPTAEPWPPTHYCTCVIYRNEENIHSKVNGATVEDKTLYKVFQLHTSHLYVLYIPTSLRHYYDIMYFISTNISYLVTLHNPRSNLSLTPSVLLSSLFPFPHPQCDTLCVQPVCCTFHVWCSSKCLFRKNNGGTAG